MITTVVLAILVVLPIAMALITIPVRIKQLSYMDLNSPRQQATELTGIGQRLVHAQANAWEALVIYLATLFLVDQYRVEPSELTTCALVYLAARIMHPIFYVANLGILRFLTFLVGFFAIGGIAFKAFAG